MEEKCPCGFHECDDHLVPADYWAILTIFGEARGEGMQGMIAVGNVIRNRMRFRFFSDGTIQDTVLRDRQFSVWNNADKQRVRVARARMDDPRLLEAKIAWERSATENLIGDAVMYHNDQVVPYWKASYAQVAVLGRHTFYAKEA